jgi:hypothetical protein
VEEDDADLLRPSKGAFDGESIPFPFPERWFEFLVFNFGRSRAWFVAVVVTAGPEEEGI